MTNTKPKMIMPKRIALPSLILFILLSACEKDKGQTNEPLPTDSFSCSDGIQNGQEIGVDCGGDCQTCPFDDSDSQELENILNAVDLEIEGIPLQIVNAEISDLPGEENDYLLNLGDIEISIFDLNSDGFEFIVPLEIGIGLKELKLEYEEQEFEIGTLSALSPLDVNPSGISYQVRDDEENPVVIIDSLNNVIVPKLKNGLLSSISIEHLGGQTSYIEVNDSNLPSKIFTDSLTILINDYDFENRTVDVAIFESEDFFNPNFQDNLPLSDSFLELLDSSNTSKNDDIQDLFSAIAVPLSGAACIITTALVNVPLGLLSCASFGISLINVVSPETLNALSVYLNANLGIKMSIIGCAALPSSFSNVNPAGITTGIIDCVNLAIEISNAIITFYNEYAESNQDDINQILALLKIDPNDESTWSVSRAKASNCGGMAISGEQNLFVAFNLNPSNNEVTGNNGLRGSWFYNGRGLTVTMNGKFQVTRLNNGEQETVTCTNSSTFIGTLIGTKEFRGSGSLSGFCPPVEGSDGDGSSLISGSAVATIP